MVDVVLLLTQTESILSYLAMSVRINEKYIRWANESDHSRSF